MNHFSIKLTILLASVSFSLFASEPALEGFEFGNVDAPDGSEWQNPERLALNKELPRARFYSFKDKESASLVLPENSNYVVNLDGKWHFKWVGNPWERDSSFHKNGFDPSNWDLISVPGCWNIEGLGKDGSKKYGTPIYVNQPVIFYHEIKENDWKKGVMRTPPENWTTFKDRNEVGQYIREFTIPANWKNREVYLEFDGVDSFFYLWVNGKYVGFSKNSRNAARFDITKYIKRNKVNRIAVEVYRSSDGSFLEAQDMFRLPGIFRSVRLFSTPDVFFSDLKVIPDIDFADNNRAALNISAKIKNKSDKDVSGYFIRYSLYPVEVYEDKVEKIAIESRTEELSVKKEGGHTTSFYNLVVPEPRFWSAEKPCRYVLVAELCNRKGKVIETVSTYTGLRKVEIRDTKAEDDSFGNPGRYYYFNNKPIKLRGVNRHETMPDKGHAITRENMEKEILLMKKANINHVRNSHYPDNQYWYYLCDKYGIYLEDEANIESHEYYYGKESLSHPAEWKPAHVARCMEMVQSHINHPSIVIWSMGNEAGPGQNFVAAYNAMKAYDKSRPVQYERNNRIVDMGSNQYPSVELTQNIASGKADVVYPFHISEYAHSMGNAVGDLKPIWDAVESSNYICGGAVWDWVDQSLYHHDPESGTRYLAYGGDFGDYPNDGQFVMNGLMFGNLEPKPQYYEVKKVYQPVSVMPVDMSSGKIEIFNKNFFEPLDIYNIEWILTEDGKDVQSGNILEGSSTTLAPRSKGTYTIPYDTTGLKGELMVSIRFRLSKDMPWAEKGYVQMEEQLVVGSGAPKPLLSSVIKDGKIEMVQSGKAVSEHISNIDSPITIKGTDFNVTFDTEKGTVCNLNYFGRKIFDKGPKLDAYRAFVNNDNWIYKEWYRNGLHNLRDSVIDSEAFINGDGNAVVRFRVYSQAPNAADITGTTSSGHNEIIELTDKPFGADDFHFVTEQTWTVYPDGSIELNADIVSSDSTLVLPRLGYVFSIPDNLNNYAYYGRGPIENYSDRKTGQNIGIYRSSVAEQFVNYTKPQNMANREEVRWTSLTDGENVGFIVIGAKPMSVTALPYTESQLLSASHIYELPHPEAIYLHVDIADLGLGGRSCGQAPPSEKNRVFGKNHHIHFAIRPINKPDQATGLAGISLE